MNNILMINNILNSSNNEYYNIIDNTITFIKNFDGVILFENSNNINLTINILDNVYVKLFEFIEGIDLKRKTIYNLSDNASLIINKFYTNKNVDEEMIVNLNGYMAKFNYNYSNICLNKEKYKFIINHNNSNSVSNISNKSICINDASIDFDIDTIVENGNVKCNMNQDTKIMNFGKNNSTIRPNMFISEDDVEARHSSVIGKFSEEELFYLMARGIDYNNSVKLLVKGYIFSNLILDNDSKSKIYEVINKYWR